MTAVQISRQLDSFAAKRSALLGGRTGRGHHVAIGTAADIFDQVEG
jgi:hypothetical protein